MSESFDQQHVTRYYNFTNNSLGSSSGPVKHSHVYDHKNGRLRRRNKYDIKIVVTKTPSQATNSRGSALNESRTSFAFRE